MGEQAVAEQEQQPRATDVDSVASELMNALNAQDGGRVFEAFGPAMRQALPLGKTEELTRGIVAAKGKLLSHARLPGDASERTGSYRFQAERGEWRVHLHVDGEGKVMGLRFTEPPPADPPVARSEIELSLPFRDEWSVFWGGGTPEVNAHVTHPSQRRAADLVRVGPDGKTHRGDGKENRDYLAYGEEILAVAQGEVITVIDGVPENAPGSMNRYFALGNAVIIRHADGVYSFYAHLQPNTLRVKVGDKVKAGAVLGLCGNTGNSSEPHLHFQLQDGPRVEDSWGIEPVFHNVVVVRDGKATDAAEYTFLKGDLISSSAAGKGRVNAPQ